MRKAMSFLILAAILATQSAAAQTENKVDEKGQKHGPWKGFFEASKRVKYEGAFDHGRETGIFTFYDDTKLHTVVATRDFSKGTNAAYTTFYDAKKNVVSEGNVVDKKYDGLWKYYHQNSKTVMISETYRSGKLEGKRSVFYPGGKIAEEQNYANGLREGFYKKYTDKGIVLEEVNYKSGELDGIAIYRDSDGTMASKGPYVNGLKKGIWEFYKAGKLDKKEKYPLRQKFAKLPPRKAD